MRLPLNLVPGLNLPSNPDHRLLARQTGVVVISDVRWRGRQQAPSVKAHHYLSAAGRVEHLLGFVGPLFPAILTFEDAVIRNRTGLAFRAMARSFRLNPQPVREGQVFGAGLTAAVTGVQTVNSPNRAEMTAALRTCVNSSDCPCSMLPDRKLWIPMQRPDLPYAPLCGLGGCEFRARP
jgi:hypothetical protein